MSRFYSWLWAMFRLYEFVGVICYPWRFFKYITFPSFAHSMSPTSCKRLLAKSDTECVETNTPILSG
ncbi:hypothetical protein GGI42DRAFT_175505 [Trichoderma sp. SZMC 28013]